MNGIYARYNEQKNCIVCKTRRHGKITNTDNKKWLWEMYKAMRWMLLMDPNSTVNSKQSPRGSVARYTSGNCL